jgi:hypothetical protein
MGRREPKKVLFFLSDGCPENGAVTAAARRAFKDELDLLYKRGVTVFGFGIEADIGFYFQNPNQYINVKKSELTLMPKLMLKKLEKILL